MVFPWLFNRRSFTAPGAFRKAASGHADWHPDRSFISPRPARARDCGLSATLGDLSLRMPSPPDMPTPKHPIWRLTTRWSPLRFASGIFDRSRPAECLALARY